MSTGEVAGLMLTIGLLGVMAGAVVAALLISRSARIHERDNQRANAYAQWLAARMTLSRASASFVTAFRALAAEPRQSDYFALRQDEAQRARVAWCDAMHAVDQAEAMLVVWSDDPLIQPRLAAFPRIRPERLRTAINGDPREVDRLIWQDREAVERAATFVRNATSASPWFRGVIGEWRACATRAWQSAIDRWRSR